MGFQILNKEGNAIEIYELDKEAAAFWNKEYQTKDYANPAEPKREDESPIDFLRRSMCSNWFDVIGYCIHSQGNACSGWSNVVATMMAESLGMHFIDTTEGYKDRPVPLVDFVSSEKLNDDGTTTKVLHLPDSIEVKIYGTLSFYKPFIELINHWHAKGYTPKAIKD